MRAWGGNAFARPRCSAGDLDKAVEDFRKSLQLDPKADETFVCLAIALRKKGDAVGARQALEEAQRLHPRSVFAKQVTDGRKMRSEACALDSSRSR